MAGTISNTANVGSTANASSYSFPTVAIGAAAADRVVAVGIGAFISGGVVSSVTIGGISAAKQEGHAPTNGNVEVWTALVPTGTAATIVVNTSAAASRCGIGVWAMYGLAGPTKSDSANASGGTSSTTAVDIPAGGVALAMGYSNDNTTSTWAYLTENFDTTVESRNYTGASLASGAGATGPTISCTFASGTDSGITVVSFAPAAPAVFVGTASFSFGQSGSLKANANLAGTATATFGQSATLVAGGASDAVFIGSTSLTFSLSGTLKADTRFAAAAAFAFNLSGAIDTGTIPSPEKRPSRLSGAVTKNGNLSGSPSMGAVIRGRPTQSATLTPRDDT